MSTEHGKPEIHGPGAYNIIVDQPVAQADGYSGEEPDLIAEAKKLAELEDYDPHFPFGPPDKINWSTLDQAGLLFIQEVNLRPWMKSTEYCSGHPLDRPATEVSELYPYRTGENVYEETKALDQAFIRGVVPDVYFRRRKSELREVGITRFYLNVNVADVKIFMQWASLFAKVLLGVTDQASNTLKIIYNPHRLGTNFTLYWDYWTMQERDLVHDVAIKTLSMFPV